MVYDTELLSYKAEDVFNIPDQESKREFGLGIDQVVTFPNVDSVTVPLIYEYEINGNEADIVLDSMKIASGIMRFNIRSTFQFDAKFVIIIPKLSLNGSPFVETLELKYNGVTPVVVDEKFDMTGYILDLTEDGSDKNKFVVKGELTVYNDKSGRPISPTDKVKVDQSIKNWKFDYIYGDFGKHEVALDKDSIEVGLFRNTTKGYFELDETSIDLYIDNTFGLPVEVNILNLYSIDNNNGDKVDILLNNFDNPFAINASEKPGQVANTHVRVDKNNSNLPKLVSPTPKHIVHEVKASTAPENYTKPQFVTKESEVKVRTVLTIPLSGYAYVWGVVDTVPFSFGEDTVKYLESLMIRFNFTNGFPFETKAQLYFLDENDVVVDSLFDLGKNFVESAAIDANGRVTNPTKVITDITIDAARGERLLRKTKSLIMMGNFETFDATETPPKRVKIYRDYKLSFLVGAVIKAKLDGEPDI